MVTCSFRHNGSAPACWWMNGRVWVTPINAESENTVWMQPYMQLRKHQEPCTLMQHFNLFTRLTMQHKANFKTEYKRKSCFATFNYINRTASLLWRETKGFSGGFSITICVHVKHWPHNHGSELGKIGYCYLAFQRPRRLHRPLFVRLWLRNLKRGKLDSRSETVRPPSASPPSSSSHGVTAHNALPTFEQ